MTNKLLSIITCLPVLCSAATDAPQSIIPFPSNITLNNAQQEVFNLSPATIIYAPTSLENESSSLVKLLSPATGFNLTTKNKPTKGSHSQIQLQLDPSLKHLGKEGYTLKITKNKVLIKAPTDTGIYYGIQSLIQLLPDEIVSSSPQKIKWSVPCVDISDSPRFSWRAFMLDEARHFKGEKEVKKLLDQMAALKMNVFHWHLTDDQGWRIEIKKYPKLTSVGSKRTDTQTGTWGSPTRSGKPHSGFYTQEQIKDIVKYAADRHITIVPEIGMPGHACAAIAAYPELGTNKKPIEVMTIFGKAYDTYDPASETTYKFISDVIDEVIELFPSQMIHIGGDEVRFDHWKNSSAVKDLMQREGLKTMADVQLYFTNRVAGIIQKKGRNVMGWNEILGDDLHGFLKNGQTAKAAKLDKDTVVHFWKGGTDIARRAIKDGHTIVNSYHGGTYLDYSYGSISLSKAYNFEPIIKGLTPAEEKRIVGTGCQMWSEWIPKVSDMERQVYPRLAAYAEVGWTQKENKNFKSFKKRINSQLKRWDIQGIGYAEGQTNVISASDFFNHEKIDSWNPQKTPSKFQHVTFSTNEKIKANGTYEVAFLYKKGAHALGISEVSLLEDGKVVATDKHEGFSGGSLNGIAYQLKLNSYKANAIYTIRAKIKGHGGTDSHGEVKIKAAEE